MPKTIIGDGGGGSGGGGGGAVTLPQMSGTQITIPFELLVGSGVVVTVYPQQNRVVLSTSLARSWFMGQGR